MRWQNTETPTFAGAAGSNKAPAVAESLKVVDRDGNVVAEFAKSVAGILSFSFNGQVVSFPTGDIPEVPFAVDAQDIADALINIGLITQAAE